MNRPVCKSCYFFNKHGAYCNRLEITNEKRNGRPTNTTCIDKMTKADAEKAGYNRTEDVLRVWFPEDEQRKIAAERKKEAENAQMVSDMIWHIKRHHI